MVVGASGVGKTSFLKQVTEKKFVQFQKSTVEVTFKRYYALDYGSILFTIWEIGGEESRWRDAYYRNADCAIIMYDMKRNRNSVFSYYQEIKKQCGKIPIVLVGNKSDEGSYMVEFKRENIVNQFQCSALHAQNIHLPFLWLSKRLTEIPNLQLILLNEIFYE